MTRASPLLLGVLFFSPTTISAGETGAKDIIIYLQSLQTASGGFLPASPQPGESSAPTLRATTSAVRALRYFGGPVLKKQACATFVDRCFDPNTGAFADTPGGKVDLFTTAVGVMAVVDLKMPVDKYAEPAIKYLAENAKTFEDIRIAAAAFESLETESPRKEQWLKEIRKIQNADGTYGNGTGKARATGGAVAAVLRLGGKVADADKVLQALKQGQRKTGGYGKDDAGDGSDLETTYRVMRSFMMLKSRPDDVPALQGLIAKCRNADGGYGVAPGQPSSASGTYFAAIIRHWLAK